jgi:two-component system, NtrC family, nitrogen regulation response regulator NtrX
MALDILIVDDEADIRSLIAGILGDEGYSTRQAANSDQVMAALSERRPSLVVLDIWLQGSKLDGLEILEQIKQRHDDLPVIVISGHGTIETAVAAIRRGAYDFIEKPFQSEQLIVTVQRATELERLRREVGEMRERGGVETELVGMSSPIVQTRNAIRKVAPSGSRVLIQGPAGSGKEVAARLLHGQSTRSDGPFVIVGSASMDPDRVEAELFGVEREDGQVRTGLLERAHGGTLFLDEVADMPLPTQGKILRVLTDQMFQRLGGNQLVRVDIRVISATARDLREEISQGRFREDLYYRLNVVPLVMPPLRDRREDIPQLAELFLKRLVLARSRRPLVFSDDALVVLQSCDWPGNVRQLRNVIERTVILAPDEMTTIDAAALPKDLTEEPGRILQSDMTTAVMASPLREAREAFEREYLKVQIRRFSGNISRTAQYIGMERSALHRKLKSLGLADASLRLDEVEID